MKNFKRFAAAGYLFLLAAVPYLFLQGCGAGSTGGSSTGTVSVSLTDAPAYGFDHVWITVRDIWFHRSDSAETESSGWVKFPLASPVTVDILDLANGNISAPVWENAELPEGDYTQIRVFLARTDAPLTGSATDKGLHFNNQVDATGDTAAYPLRVPNADLGIRLTGNFKVQKNEKLHLVIDFDAGEDVVKVDHDGKTDYILKPRLLYFDLNNAGAIVGSIDTAAAADNGTAHFVFKAEQMSPNGQFHQVRRATAVADGTGKFILFPLPPGSYDIVMRGINYQTTIIKGVTVRRGTKPNLEPTVIPTITMTKAVAPDYGVSASITSPTGAWVTFYQTLPGTGEVPYDIRFRHFNPLTGNFADFQLSADPIQVGTYNPAGIWLTSVTPIEGAGCYKAVAGGHMYQRGDAIPVTPSQKSALFGNLSVSSPATARSVSGSVVVPQSVVGFLDRGVLFATHGGMIVNAIKVDAQMASGGDYLLANLPGGTRDRPLFGAFYGIEAFGWQASSPENKGAATPQFVNLTTGDAKDVNINMAMLP